MFWGPDGIGAARGPAGEGLCPMFQLLLSPNKDTVRLPSGLPWRGKCDRPQCSCLENPVDRGAWRAAVHGVTKSGTRLSDQHTAFGGRKGLGSAVPPLRSLTFSWLTRETGVSVSASRGCWEE